MRGATRPRRDADGAVTLRLERGESLGRELGVDAVALEVEADRRVAVAPRGERERTAAREPRVVEEAGLRQHRDRARPLGRRDGAPLEALLQPPRREVAVAKRAGGGGERVVAPELAADRSGTLAVELRAHPEPGPRDHLERERPPGRAVELDRDPVSALASKLGYTRQGALTRRHLLPLLLRRRLAVGGGGGQESG
jgi:hypothetical protein